MPKFLISRLSALGDTICSLPAAVALKRGFPDCHITWVVDPRFAGIVECCSAVDEVLRFKPSHKKIPTYPDRFDAALDLQGLLKSAVCIARAKADRKVGYHWQREGARFFSERVLPDPSSFHVVDQYVDVARAVGGVMDKAQFELVPRPEDLESVERKLREGGIHTPFLLVNAGAGWVTKRWQPSSFAQVIDAAERRGLPTVLLGGKDEPSRQAAREVTESCQSRPLNLVGETSVRELVTLVSKCAVHLGGDTGSTHLAAALDRPAVGLYSITRPERSGPYGQIHRCHFEPESLSSISPDAVIGTVLEAA